MCRGWLLPLAAAGCACGASRCVAAAGGRRGAEEAVGAARPEAEAEGQQECEHTAMRLQALQTRSALAGARGGERTPSSPWATRAEGNPYAPAPNLYLKELVNPSNYRGYCLDISGSSPSGLCEGAVQGRSCKTEGEDTQFMYDPVRHEIRAVNFNAMCRSQYNTSKDGMTWEAVTAPEDVAPGCLQVDGDLVAGATLRMGACVGTQLAKFTYTPRGQFTVGGGSLCLVLGLGETSLSDIWMRSAELQSCDSWPAELSTWEVLVPDHTKLVDLDEVHSLSDRTDSIHKHTYSSNRASEDSEFMNRYICPADTGDAPSQCAVSMKASCNGFDVHMVTSYVTENGSQTPDEWFSYMSALHGDMKEWDQFMHYGTTFYATDLSDHLEKFQADGVPFMARKTSSDTTLYSLLVQTPSAKIMEIVSTRTPSSSASLFVEWGDDECPVSHERNLSEIKALSHSLSEISDRPRTELPTLTAIGVNIVASAQTVNDIGAWLEKYGLAPSKPTLHTGSSCTVASIMYSNAEVRYVSNPGARVGSKTVDEYEEMQMAAHKQYVGNGTGWDAWMDNHWCIGVAHSKFLDPIANQMADDGELWHAHGTNAAASVRTAGIGGESIELNGITVGSYLTSMSGFEWCTADTDHV